MGQKEKEIVRNLTLAFFLFTTSTIGASTKPEAPKNLFPKARETFVPESTSEIIFLTPTAGSEPLPTEIPEIVEPTVVEALLWSFIDDVANRREERAKKDPDFYRRVDQELNLGRVNFLLFGYGDSHEPPYDKLEIASPSILSIDYRSGNIDLVSLTHDIRDPLIEEVLGIKRQKRSAQRLDQSLLNKKAVKKVGQFKLPQLSLENATGLSIDYQIHFNDEAMGRFIDSIGGIEVESPMRIPLQAYWYEGKKYEEKGWVIEQGPKKLSGREAVGYLKSIPLYEPPSPNYKPEMEHNFRKALVFKALQEVVKKNLTDNGFKAKIAAFLLGEVIRGQTAYDFNPTLVVKSLIGQVKKDARPSLEIPQLQLRKTLYVVAKGNSVELDTPVHWVDSSSQPGEEEVYQKNLGYEIPEGGNPYGKLIDYWNSVRKWIRTKLLTR